MKGFIWQLYLARVSRLVPMGVWSLQTPVSPIPILWFPASLETRRTVSHETEVSRQRNLKVTKPRRSTESRKSSSKRSCATHLLNHFFPVFNLFSENKAKNRKAVNAESLPRLGRLSYIG
ncbi:hypothetical protein [Rufibacter quisquiliarum]|uniref:Uncharacterized protein n=1 Tax=Rufibacter quisquiliarum TaxID=1549639 RepID=A0A839GJ52_9BACT|nr:hypothetical protein [Rufibacter quisquiliarum]MBA9075635.1 hypothetical protein [Rufibacter quisquiliarum]